MFLSSLCIGIDLSANLLVVIMWIKCMFNLRKRKKKYFIRQCPLEKTIFMNCLT